MSARSPFPLLRRLVSRLPAYPPAFAAAVAANVCAGAVLNARHLPAARGKVIAIEVRDAGLCLAFTVDEDGLVAARRPRPDAVIRADARDFLALARRTEDPDTLFFDRRLVVEGDTEFALLVKNTLDAIDFRTMRWPPPSRILDAFALQWRAWLPDRRERDGRRPVADDHR